MRLLSVRVQDFRCVEDSQEFSVSEVTCLVGKNESGKTALLKALHKLRPDEAAKEAFEPAKDYPRRKWRPDTAIPPQPPAVFTTWELGSEDLAALEERFGSGAISDTRFTLSKGYDNVRRYDISVDEAAVIKAMLGAHEHNAAERKPLSGSKTVAAAILALEKIASRTSAQEDLLQALKEEFPKGRASCD